MNILYIRKKANKKECEKLLINMTNNSQQSAELNISSWTATEQIFEFTNFKLQDKHKWSMQTWNLPKGASGIMKPVEELEGLGAEITDAIGARKRRRM